MRGINISSIMFLVIVLWNVIVFCLLGYCKRKRAKPKSDWIGVLLTAVINVVLILSFIVFSSNIEVTHYTVKSERLPVRFNGYRILQISDFHSGSFQGGTKSLIKKVVKEKPDMIVLTGDLIDETALDLSPVSELISRLAAIAPVYYVSGNHDIWYHDFSGLKDMLERKGVVLLENKKQTIALGRSHINLFGVADPDEDISISPETYVVQKMQTLKPDIGYNILLFHRANLFNTIKGNGYQLVLSGHMHGGQIQIPFVGGLVSPQGEQICFPEFTDGKWEKAGTTMVVSRGLGNNAPVPRIFNPPQLVVVKLECK